MFFFLYLCASSIKRKSNFICFSFTLFSFQFDFLFWFIFFLFIWLIYSDINIFFVSSLFIHHFSFIFSFPPRYPSFFIIRFRHSFYSTPSFLSDSFIFLQVIHLLSHNYFLRFFSFHSPFFFLSFFCLNFFLFLQYPFFRFKTTSIFYAPLSFYYTFFFLFLCKSSIFPPTFHLHKCNILFSISCPLSIFFLDSFFRFFFHFYQY